jgi:hypothetical protein
MNYERAQQNIFRSSLIATVAIDIPKCYSNLYKGVSMYCDLDEIFK